MPKTRRRLESTDVIERVAADFARKTVTHLAKLSRDERALRLAAFEKIVERAESRQCSGRSETQVARATLVGRKTEELDWGPPLGREVW